MHGRTTTNRKIIGAREKAQKMEKGINYKEYIFVSIYKSEPIKLS